MYSPLEGYLEYESNTYILNTNYANNQQHTEDMLRENKVAAYHPIKAILLIIKSLSLEPEVASAKRKATDNENYTFRCWMLRLGLIGKEFKTCRHHFLANLTGNSVWRNAA